MINWGIPMLRYINPIKATLIRKILAAFPQVDYIMDGLYASQDEEYLDGKAMDEFVIK